MHTLTGRLQNSGHGYSITQFLFSVISCTRTMCTSSANKVTNSTIGKCTQLLLVATRHLCTAHELLDLFYTLTPKLYHLIMCSANMHTLVQHMCKFVGTWGPLWCYSTLGFENLNGHLRRHCHGTCNVLPQLVHTIHKQQMLSLVQNRLMESENPSTVAYLKIMLALRRLKQIWRSLQ